VLKSLRNGMTVVDQEMREIAQQLKVKEHGSALLRKSPDFRRSLTLGIMLQVVQQLTGISVEMYYAPRIFGWLDIAVIRRGCGGAVIVGAVNVLATFVAIGLVDRWGGRPILLTGFTVMAAGTGTLGGLLALGISPYLHANLRGTECQFHRPHFLLCAGNTRCSARTERAEPDGWQAAARDWALSADSVSELCIS